MSENIIISNLQIIRGWERKVDQFGPLLKSCLIKKDAEIRPGEFVPQDKYELSVTLGVELWANDAQLNDSVRVAKKVMATRIYGDINGFVEELKKAIHDGDRNAALNICNMILEYTKG